MTDTTDLGSGIVLHAAATLYHQIVRRDNLLARMWFGKRQP